MRESANLCENRLTAYRGDVNAALGTKRSFPPCFTVRFWKTEGSRLMATESKVKTKHRGNQQGPCKNALYLVAGRPTAEEVCHFLRGPYAAGFGRSSKEAVLNAELLAP